MDFTQRQVAALLGYHDASDISHYEHGHKLPSLITALKLEIVYRVPVAFLYHDLYLRLRHDIHAKEERRAAREWGRAKI
jgi:transcriptional regulator with XRE-family HTH domain